jgi:hypothetical protein
MLIVSPTQSSLITVTLYELASNQVNPYFTFELIKKGSHDKIYFTNDDLSTSPWYWNQYMITPSTGTPGLTQGIIPLMEGEYVYNVYETSAQYDITLSTLVGKVETGIMIVGTVVNTIPAFTTNDNAVIPVFKRN